MWKCSWKVTCTEEATETAAKYLQNNSTRHFFKSVIFRILRIFNSTCHWFNKMSRWIINTYLTLIQKALKVSIYINIIIYIDIYLSIYLPSYLSIYLPSYLYIYLPTYVPTYLPTYYLPTYLPIYLPIYLYIHLSIYLYIKCCRLHSG